MPNSRQIWGLILPFSTGGQRSRSVTLCVSRRVVSVLWKTTVKLDGCSSLVLWWHVYLPSSKNEVFIFTLSAYLSHSLPTHVPLRHLSLSTNLIYLLILVFSCFTLLKDAFSYIQKPGLKEWQWVLWAAAHTHHGLSSFLHWGSLQNEIADIYLAREIKRGSLEISSVDFNGLCSVNEESLSPVTFINVQPEKLIYY